MPQPSQLTERLHQELDEIATSSLYEEPSFPSLQRQHQQLQQIEEQAQPLNTPDLEKRIHLYKHTLDTQKKLLREQVPYAVTQKEDLRTAQQQVCNIQSRYINNEWKPKHLSQLKTWLLDVERCIGLLEHNNRHEEAEEARGFEAVLEKHILGLEEQKTHTRKARLTAFVVAITTIISLLEGYDLFQKRWHHTPPLTSAQKTEAEQRTTQLLTRSHGQALYVDKDQQQLFYLLKENGKWNCHQGFPITLGTNSSPKQKEGDKATPEGIYAIKQAIYNQNAQFGPVRYVLNYPNTTDREYGRTGNGIIITATTLDTYTEGIKQRRNVTNGSIVLTQKHLHSLEKSLTKNLSGNAHSIPVIIEDSRRQL